MNKIFKSLAAMLAVAAIAATMTACGSTKEEAAPAEGTDAPAAEAKFTAGTYSAEADGFGGAVKVDVTVDENAITEVKVVEHAETDGIGTEAIEQLPATIIEAQGAEVEAIAGCTVTSDAILAAVTTALEEAGK